MLPALILLWISFLTQNIRFLFFDPQGLYEHWTRPKNLGEYLHGHYPLSTIHLQRRYPPLNAPPGGRPRWRPVLGLLFSDSFVRQLKPLLTHFKNSLALVPSISLSILNVSNYWSFSYSFTIYTCIREASTTVGLHHLWHLCYVAFLDWPRSFPRKWWNLFSLCVYRLIYLLVLQHFFSVGQSPHTNKLSKDLTQTNKHNLAKVKICQTYSRGAILDSNSDTKFGFQV